jgi:hypothetical protein
MELVEGPTLADRIAQGAIPMDEALPIAKQIAEALEGGRKKVEWISYAARSRDAFVTLLHTADTRAP